MSKRARAEKGDGSLEARVKASLADAQAGRVTRHSNALALIEHLEADQQYRPLAEVVDIVSGFGFPKELQGKLKGDLGENPPRACIIPSTVGPAIVKADCIRFKPHSSMHAKYLNAALNCLPTRQRVKDVLHGIGRPRLSLGEIRSIALPVPPETEQHRIVAEVDLRLSLLRETEAQVDANFQRAERLCQSILSRAFSAGDTISHRVAP